MKITIEALDISGNKQITDLMYCSFCGKQSDFVEKLIAGPGVFICNECVNLCVEIIIEGRITAQQEVQGE